MIVVRYFASIRETLELDCEELELPAGVHTAAELIEHLVAVHGELWAETLQDKSVLVAINQSISKLSDQIASNDEIAFFPPVTGG